MEGAGSLLKRPRTQAGVTAWPSGWPSPGSGSGAISVIERLDRFLLLLEQQFGQRVLNDVHGLTTFRTEPEPRFAIFNANAILSRRFDDIVEVVNRILPMSPTMNEQELLALNLFHMSFFETSPDSRLITLVTAVEAMVPPQKRSPAAVRHVEELVRLTGSANHLDVDDRSALANALRMLEHRSVGAGARALARERLGDARYAEQPAARFFGACYKLRSDLVHGREPRPTREEVGSLAAPLEVFVSDLLTVKILGPRAP